MPLQLLRLDTALQTARTAVGWAVNAVVNTATMPERISDLIAATETLVTQGHVIAGRIQTLLERAEQVFTEAEATIKQVNTLTTAASGTIEDAAHISSKATLVVTTAKQITDQATGVLTQAQQSSLAVQDLLSIYEPLIHKLAPLAKRFVEELTPKEVDAAIRLVDELPVLAEHISSDVLPILATLDRVGPDIHELLEVTYDLRRVIVGIPGFKFFRRRGQQRTNPR